MSRRQLRVHLQTDTTHKYTQQVHTQTGYKDQANAYKLLINMETHIASTVRTIHKEMGWMSRNVLLVRLTISKCVFVRKCRRAGCAVRVLTYLKMMVFNTHVI